MNQVAELEKEIHLLRHQLALAETKIAERDAQMCSLQEQLRHYLSRRFAASSEKASPDQMGLFNEAEEAVEENKEKREGETTPVKSHERRTKPRVSIPDALPREEIIHDLPDEEKICPHDGSPLKVIGSEDHEQLDIIPAQIKVLRHKRLKYACPCCDQHIVTARKPKQPIEKSIASPGLLAYVAVQKYCDALPLYRHDCMDAGGRATQEQLPNVKY